MKVRIIKIFSFMLLLQLAFLNPGSCEIIYVSEPDFDFWLKEADGNSAAITSEVSEDDDINGMYIVKNNSNEAISERIRITSPKIFLPAQENGKIVWLSFWQTLSNNSNKGNSPEFLVEISEDGINWLTVFGPIKGIQEAWKLAYVDITRFRNSTIQIAFTVYQQTVTDSWWKIDGIAIESLDSTAFPIHRKRGN